MSLPVLSTPATLQAFEVFAPLSATPGTWRVVGRYVAYDGLTPVEVNATISVTDEMYTYSEIQADLDYAGGTEFATLGWDAGL